MIHATHSGRSDCRWLRFSIVFIERKPLLSCDIKWMPRTKKPCAVSKGRALTSNATTAERLAAMEADTSRLGRGNSLAHRILRARLAVAAFLQVEYRFSSDYGRELKEAVREGRSGIRDGILYECEVLVRAMQRPRRRGPPKGA